MQAGFSCGGGLGDVGSVPSIWRLGVPLSTMVLRLWGWVMLVSVIGLRLSVVGGGIHTLHWNMLSCLELGWSQVLCGFRLRRVGRLVSGDCMLGVVCGKAVGGGSVGELFALCWRALLCGLGVEELGLGWFGYEVGVWAGVSDRLRGRCVRVGVCV